MPELPEVETIARGLRHHIVGKRIRAITESTPKSFPNDPTLVANYVQGAYIKKIQRRAKVLIISLDTQFCLLIHLKMTGQLIYVGSDTRWGGGHPNDSLFNSMPDRSTRVIIEFYDKSHLYFNDQRKFGWVKVVAKDEIANIDFFKRLGPEPLSPQFSYRVFANNLARRKNTSIKAAILDQSIVAGVGNIYADESLHIARIHPAARVGDVSSQAIIRLWKAIPQVLALSIRLGGSSDRNYVDIDGKRGNYLKFAKVFRRDAQPCPNCATIISKTRVAGRGTHFCPNCQKLPKPKTRPKL